MNRSSASRFGRPVALVCAGLLALVVALPASAAIYSRETYEETAAWTHDDCGPVVDATGTFGGTFSLRAGTGKDEGAFFAHDTFEFREVHVRRSDGKTAVVVGILNSTETRGTRVEGSVFALSSIFAGQFAMYDGDGALIFRDRGTINETILIDTQGDGEYLGTLSSVMHGQYPGTADGAFCEFWN